MTETDKVIHNLETVLHETTGRVGNNRKLIFWAFIGSLIGSVVTGVVITAYYLRQPPNVVISEREESTVEKIGDGKIRLVFVVNKKRLCESNVQRWLFKFETNNGTTKAFPVYLFDGSIPSPPIPTGIEKFGIELTIPREWDVPGVFYQSRAYYHCGLGLNWLEPEPSQTTPFEINAAVAASEQGNLLK